MSLTIPPELESKLSARSEAEGVTVAAYLEQLLREEDEAVAHTEALLQEAAESGEHVDLTEIEWDQMEREARHAVQMKSKRPA